MKNKYSIYEAFIGRLEDDYRKGYYFQSAWLEFALLEDRLNSILSNSGGKLQPKATMGPKIKELKKRSETNRLLYEYFEKGLMLDRIETWKEVRNRFMHNMANGTMTVAEIDAEIKALANEGAVLVRDFASIARRVKKYSHK